MAQFVCTLRHRLSLITCLSTRAARCFPGGFFRSPFEPARGRAACSAQLGMDRGSCDWRHFGRLAGFTNQKKERRLDKRTPAIRETAMLRKPSLLTRRRVSSRGRGAKARPPFTARASKGNPASMDRCRRSASYFVPRRSTLRRRSSPRGHGVGGTCCRSRSLSRANRARNPEQPRSVQKGSAAALVGVRRANCKQRDRSPAQ